MKIESKGKEMPKISVIVPVYNIKEEYLRKCIESLLGQTFQDLQLVLVDDGSTDGSSGEVCDEYGRLDQRVTVIHQINQGVAVARNTGLAKAEGEWITFVDADDWCELCMCEKLLQKAGALKPDILIFTNYSVNEKGEIGRNQFFKEDMELLDHKMKEEAELKTIVRSHPAFSFQPPYNMIGGTWCKLINRDFLVESGVQFEPELLRSQDIIFYLNLFEKAGKISYYNEPLYYYRYGADSVSKRYRPDAYKIFILVLRKQAEFIRAYHKPEVFQEVFTKGVMGTVGTCMRTDYVHEQNRKSFRERCRDIRTMIRLEPIHGVLKNSHYKSLNRFQVVHKVLLKYNLVEIYLLLLELNAWILKSKRGA